MRNARPTPGVGEAAKRGAAGNGTTREFYGMFRRAGRISRRLRLGVLAGEISSLHAWAAGELLAQAGRSGVMEFYSIQDLREALRLAKAVAEAQFRAERAADRALERGNLEGMFRMKNLRLEGEARLKKPRVPPSIEEWYS